MDVRGLDSASVAPGRLRQTSRSSASRWTRLLVDPEQVTGHVPYVDEALLLIVLEVDAGALERLQAEDRIGEHGHDHVLLIHRDAPGRAPPRVLTDVVADHARGSRVWRPTGRTAHTPATTRWRCGLLSSPAKTCTCLLTTKNQPHCACLRAMDRTLDDRWLAGHRPTGHRNPASCGSPCSLSPSLVPPAARWVSRTLRPTALRRRHSTCNVTGKSSMSSSFRPSPSAYAAAESKLDTKC